MVQTPWGELAINDAHIHFFSRPFYSGLARQKKAESAESLSNLLNWDIPVEDPAALAGKWIDELDGNGVNRAVLIASAPGDEASVAAAVRAYPHRFFGYFMLDPLQPDALDRVKAASSNSYLHGICLFPAMHTYSITDARLVPLLEIASDARLAVFVHCGAISVGVRKKLALPSQFDMRYSNPLDLHPVALHFPQIRFVVPHFGAGLFRGAPSMCSVSNASFSAPIPAFSRAVGTLPSRKSRPRLFTKSASIRNKHHSSSRRTWSVSWSHAWPGLPCSRNCPTHPYAPSLASVRIS